MVPRYNTQIVGQGLAWLTWQFQQPNCRAWLAAILSECQALEDATWTVLAGRFLSTATLYSPPETNDVLDVIGELVGQHRNGMSDADYKSLIYLRIAVNRATGCITDWSGFGKILLRTAGGPVSYIGGGSSIYLGVWDMELNSNVVADALSHAVPNGQRGTFAYSTWADGNDFEFSDANNMSTTGQGGFGDAVAGLVGGVLVSGAAI